MSLNYEQAAKPSVEQVVKAPPLYSVILLNDDFTPQEFVVDLLQQVFAMPLSKAMAIMLQIHHQGSGVCGVYTQEIATIKVAQVQTLAKEHEHPLRCVMQET